jgi:PmbA protein
VTRALEVAVRALELGPDEAEVVVVAERSGFARFAGSEVHQPTLVDDVSVTLRAVLDGRVGTASTNRLDDGGLREIGRRAAEAAGSSPREEGFPGLAQPAELPAVQGFDPATAGLSPDELARHAAAAIEAAELPVYGFFTSGSLELAVASSAGVRAEQATTDATAFVIAAAEGASGCATRTAWRAADVDAAAVAREADEKAARTRGARELEPGIYPAVLEPYALGELLEYFAYDSFGGLGLLEERSYLTGRLGERVFDPKVSIADDALDPRGLPKAFDFEGVPKRRVEIVTEGTARGVVWDRRTAALAGDSATTTGHAPSPLASEWGPHPGALQVAPGEAASVEELAETVGDGLYVTRLHYLGVVHPREGVITGMTRDGTFRIRNGRIAEPLVNLRFTVAVPELLAEVPGLTSEPMLVNQSDFYGERDPYGVLTPALATARFHVTGNGSTPGI